MSNEHVPTGSEEERRLESQTDEGAQLLRPLTGEAREREMVLTGGPWPDDDDTMIINMGPQHPSTHGVLRIMMELDGETVLRAKPVVGYLHTGMEKTGEELTYVQGATNVTRMDYASPLSNELVYSMAVERLLDIEVPERAVWIRMMMVELNRMSSHLLVPGDERDGPRRGLDDDLRLARARGDAPPARDDHRPADEPQLHPPRWCRGRPPRRLASRDARGVRRRRARVSPSTGSCSSTTRSGGSARSASA